MLFQGVKFTRNEDGDIFAINLSNETVVAKGYISPSDHCLSDEVINNLGRLGRKPMKVPLHLLIVLK